MKKTRYGFLVSSFLLTLCAASAETLVGELSGEFSVNNLGAANYTVPLAISPGTAGVEPKLSVAYSSRGGNDLLGVGFSLEGLSTITRGGASIDQDGFIDGVDFDDNDRFLLDGQRLEIVSPSTNKINYGNAGTEYRTEIDSFSRVIAYGQAGNGPASFKVWTKSGLIYEYGNTTDSSFEPGTNTSVLSWAVNKVSDTAGNYMTFTYTETTAGSQISLIDYTGNTNGLAPYNSVEFAYEVRPDSSLRFFKGAQMTQSNRLSKITMKHNNNTHMHEYRLGYTNSAAGQSLLESVQQFFGSNVAADCLPKNRFEYSGISVASNFNYRIGSGLASRLLDAHTPIWSGDFNGDGLTDIFTIGNENTINNPDTWVGLSMGDGTFTFKDGADFLPSVDYTSSTDTILTGDFNGDGWADICQVSAYDGGANDRWLALSEGDGSFTMTYGSNFLPDTLDIYKTAGILAQDFNGDGRTDLAGFDTSGTGSYESKIWVGLSNPDGTFSVTNGYGVLPQAYKFYSGNDFLLSGDFNGDGRSDIMAVGPDNQNRWVGLSKTNGTFTFVVDTNLLSFDIYGKSSDLVRTGDFNGDGLTDIFLLAYNNSDHWIGLSNGNGTFDFTEGSGFLPVVEYTPSTDTILTGDFNGDGLTDICQVSGLFSDVRFLEASSHR